MEPHDRVSSFILGILGFAVAAGAYQLDLGEIRNPGPGFFPFWAGLALAAISFIVFGKTYKGNKEAKQDAPPSPFSSVRWKTLGLVIMLMILYANTFELLGFVIGTFIMMVFLFKIDRSQRWLVSAASAAATVLATYLLFELIFQSGFPRGLLG
jgi:putative tricarboxylic transport membrane protein